MVAVVWLQTAMGNDSSRLSDCARDCETGMPPVFFAIRSVTDAFESEHQRNLKDSGSMMVLAQRSWQAAAGVITLAFVAHFLSPVEQGYFYALASLAALYMVLDMGLSTVLVQYAAREFVGLSWGGGGKVEGTAPSRFLTLVRLSLRWYGTAAVIFLLAYPAGVAFLANGHGDLGYDWRGPWALLVFATAAGLVFLPALALIEGSGAVVEVYAVRLVQGVVGALATWGVLVIGGGLYAVTMMPAAGAVIASVWLFVRRRRMLMQAIQEKVGSFHWGVEVWSLQWRIGASWLAGYALVLMHVPLLFRTQGPVVAGQMGATMTAANMLSILALSWVTARIPTMTRAVSTKDWVNLDYIYWKAFRASILAFVAGATLFIIMRSALDWTPYGKRFLPMAQTAGLLFAMGFYHVTGLFAAYLRAHLQEPFLWPSLLGAFLTAVAAIWVAPQWGAAGIVTVLVVINAAFFLPIALWLWVHLRRKWHAETV
jgi:O-antigen/teichoic acid export membrane protein